MMKPEPRERGRTMGPCRGMPRKNSSKPGGQDRSERERSTRRTVLMLTTASEFLSTNSVKFGNSADQAPPDASPPVATSHKSAKRGRFLNISSFDWFGFWFERSARPAVPAQRIQHPAPTAMHRTGAHRWPHPARTEAPAERTPDGPEPRRQQRRRLATEGPTAPQSRSRRPPPAPSAVRQPRTPPKGKPNSPPKLVAQRRTTT